MYEIFESVKGGSDVVFLGVSRPNIGRDRIYTDLDYLEHYGVFSNQACDFKFLDVEFEGVSEMSVYVDKHGRKFHDSFETDFTYALFKTLDGEDGCVMLTLNLFAKLYNIKKKEGKNNGRRNTTNNIKKSKFNSTGRKNTSR